LSEAIMSKKRDKMILKYLKRRSAPKRIAGVKIPKALRRAAETELGAAIIALILVSGAGLTLTSPGAAKLRKRTRKIAEKVASVLDDSANEVAARANAKRHKDEAELLPH
jgi:hypothetical protein